MPVRFGMQIARNTPAKTPPFIPAYQEGRRVRRKTAPIRELRKSYLCSMMHVASGQVHPKTVNLFHIVSYSMKTANTTSLFKNGIRLL